MLLWISLAVMSAAVLVSVARPLLRPTPAIPRREADATAIYRDQIREIDAELAQGVIGAADADAARTEVARRLLAADAEQAAQQTALDQTRGDTLRQRLALTLAAGLPVLAVAMYLALGSPHLPGQPLSARLANPNSTANVDNLVHAVETRLRQHPEDGQGWDVIAPVYFKQGRYSEAADAFAKAARILGDTSRRLAGFAEATVLANDGIVIEPARLAYEKLVKLEPGRIEPRFWLAMAKEQDGRLEAAIADYQKMLQEGPPDASWRPLVVERIEEINGKLGAGGLAGLPTSKTTKLATAKESPGPNSVDIAAAERMPSADRQAMIEGMVEGLATRLKANGRDLPGWERLIRAYSIMGRKTDAVAALDAARRNFKDDPQPLAQLTELARSLGLDS